MSIAIDEVRRVAHLARLDLPEDALVALAEDIDAILAHVAQLEEVDVEGVAPTTSGIEATAPWRTDRPTSERVGQRLLAGAPDRVGDAVAVPRILE